jgi:hypothetical protein
MSSETESWFAAAGNPAHPNLQGNPHHTEQTRQLPTNLPTRLCRQIKYFAELHGRLPMTVRDRARATRCQGIADIIVRQHNGVRQRQNKGSLIVEGMCFPRRLSLGRIA